MSPLVAIILTGAMEGLVFIMMLVALLFGLTAFTLAVYTLVRKFIQ